MRTYSRCLGLLPHDRNALDDGGSGIVDAIEHRLREVSSARLYVIRPSHLLLIVSSCWHITRLSAMPKYRKNGGFDL